MLGDIELYPHQEEARDKLSNGKILWGGVGSGKSLTAAAYYMKVEADADVYVITTAKKRDSLEWESEFAKFGVGKHLDGTLGGALTVDSWNNIGKYRNVVGGFFIFDEQRLVGSGEWTSVFLEIVKRNRWILLTATPGDTWLDYIPVFLAHGFYKNRTEFKRDHVIYAPYTRFPKVDRYVGVGKLVRLRNHLLVEMPFTRHTTRQIERIQVPYHEQLLHEAVKKRWDVFENRPLRNIAELFGVMRRVVNSDPSRVRAVRTLLETHPKLIVFYNYNYELALLKEGLSQLTTRPLEDLRSLTPESNEDVQLVGVLGPQVKLDEIYPRLDLPAIDASVMETKCNIKKATGTKKTDKYGSGEENNELSLRTETAFLEDERSTRLVVAEWNGHKHENIPSGDTWIYLVQYTAGAEGWNCTATDAMVFYSLNYSWRLMHQAYGRIDRLNTPFSLLHYYILESKSPVDRAIGAALEQKRNFNEAAYLRNLSKSLRDEVNESDI